jgi:hypothetical protein
VFLKALQGKKDKRIAALISKTSQPIAGERLAEHLRVTTNPIHFIFVGSAWQNLA